MMIAKFTHLQSFVVNTPSEPLYTFWKSLFWQLSYPSLIKYTFLVPNQPKKLRWEKEFSISIRNKCYVIELFCKWIFYWIKFNQSENFL